MSIEDDVRKFCDTGARAVHRYCEVAGILSEATPEYFMPAYIFDHLGDGITMTLETGFRDLVDWNNDALKRRGQPSRPELPPEILGTDKDPRGRRVDLVMYKGNACGLPKNEQEILALVEFKRGWIDPTDRSKLLDIFLLHIDTCPYGVACGWIRAGTNAAWHEAAARERGDRWFSSPVPALPHGYTQDYVFGACLFERKSSRGPLIGVPGV